MHDVIVIGAGPAGVSAALEGARRGLTVLLLDEQSAAGGQIYRNVKHVCERRPADAAILGAHYSHGATLVEKLSRSSVEYVPGASVWHVGYDDIDVYYNTSTASCIASARALVLAHGAMERPVPVPGWTLPGVMAAGAAQVLFKTAGLVPEGPVVLAGTGPLLLLVAAQLSKAGANIALLAETTTPSHYVRAFSNVVGTLHARRYLREGLRLEREIRSRAIPRRRGLQSVAALGSTRVDAVRLGFNDGECEIPARALLLHAGVIPNSQLTRMMELDHEPDPLSSAWRPKLDAFGESPRKNVFVTGDAARILGARAAELTGRLAALRIAERVGCINSMDLTRDSKQLLRELRHEHAARVFLDTLFQPRAALVHDASPGLMLCRCYEITREQVMRACAEGCATIDHVKSLTRSGMGPCQGRMCSASIARLIATTRDSSIDAVPLQRTRPPLKPLTLAQLASLPMPARPGLRAVEPT